LTTEEIGWFQEERLLSERILRYWKGGGEYAVWVTVASEGAVYIMGFAPLGFGG
jgi:hypothetical protein